MGRAAPTKDGSLKLDGMSKIKEETSPVWNLISNNY